MNTKLFAAVGCVVALVGFTASAANTWHVDDDNYDPNIGDDPAAYIAAGFDGTTEAKAFGTIQAAIDALTTKSGDTILVHPGVYDKGEHDVNNGAGQSLGLARVFINEKRLYIHSTGGAAVTHIVGRKTDDAAEFGCGPTAVRCVGSYYATGAEIKGFTLRDGASQAYTGTDTIASMGGALVSWPNNTYVWLVDSVVSNCSSRTGISYYSGNVRTLFINNRINVDGVARTSQNFACVFSHNRSAGYSCISGGTSVNCTIVNNHTPHGVSGGAYYNCILALTSTVKENLDGAVLTDTVASAVDGVYQTVAPALDDWRVLKGSAAETRGKSANIANITLHANATFDLKTDFFGRPIPETETICAGASQTVVDPEGGALVFDYGSAYTTRNLFVNGCSNVVNKVYAYAEKYPVQWPIRLDYTDGTTRLLNFTRSVESFPNVPDPKTGITWTMPPPKGVVETIGVRTCTWGDVYVSDEEGDDETADGSEQKPYKTIQAAIDANDSVFVWVKPGRYDEGGKVYHGVSNRVALVNKSIALVSTEGAEKTFIVGAADPAYADDPEAPGCGPAAVRCVCFSGSHTIQGFTLVDGHGAGVHGIDESTADSLALGRQGGCIRATGTDTYLFDCVITNGGGYDSVILASRLTRCRVEDCHGRSYVLQNAGLISSAMTGCSYYNGAVCAGDSILIQNATIVGPDQAFNPFGGQTGLKARGVIVKTGGLITEHDYWGSVFWDMYSGVAGATGYVEAPPFFANESAGDYRLIESSPAIGAGCTGTGDYAGFCHYAFGDIDNEPILFRNGRSTPGCCQTTVMGVGISVIGADRGGLAVTGGKIGDNVLAPGESLTISAAAGTRPCVGFTDGAGTTNLFDEAEGYTYSYDSLGGQAALVFSPVYTDDWYVSPEGDDAASGFYPGAAFRTLTNAMAHAVSGDTVRALPGTYAEGDEAHAAGYEIRSRVVVKANVTLESTDGPEKTVILGGQPTGNPDTRGCGAGAVRCAYVKNGGRISGFTLTDGRTKGKNDPTAGFSNAPHYHDDWSGGGVLGQSESATAANCIIRRNAAYRGGGARSILLDTCQVIDNTAVANSPAAGESRCVNTLFKDNWGAANCYASTLFDCTFRGCWNDEAKTQTGEAFYADIGAGSDKTTVRWANIVVERGYVRYHAYEGVECTLCANIFATGLSNLPSGTTAIHGVTRVTAAELAFGADDRPIAGTSCIVDRSDPAYTSPKSDYLTDAAGGQRVYNGARDVGAMEADWRPNYGKDIGARFAVEAATPGVVESDAGKVVIAAGEALSGTWPVRAGRSVPRLMSFTVAEGGSATVTVDGVSTTYAAGAHEQRFDATAANDVRIACTAGSVTVDRFRNELGALLLVR